MEADRIAVEGDIDEACTRIMELEAQRAVLLEEMERLRRRIAYLMGGATRAA